jgi:hypothetical protein
MAKRRRVGDGAAGERPNKTHLFPDPLELAPRGVRTALGQAVREDDSVDRPCAGAAHHVELERLFLQQPVEHAPREGAERAAAL